MGLNKQKGNMYGFITHTWNTVKGKCEFDCSYCYMKRFPQKPVRFDEKELKTDLGTGNFIFVGSSCDMFAPGIPDEWIERILGYLVAKQKRTNNTYLFQSKNPARFIEFLGRFPVNPIFGTTIESNFDYPEISKAPPINERVFYMHKLSSLGYRTMVTIEPILNFDVGPLVEMIQKINPEWVNIGADSGNNNLPEPSKKKIAQLIYQLPDIKIKTNLKRLL